MKDISPEYINEETITLQTSVENAEKNDWNNKPESWPDIRENAQDGHIYLLVDTRYPIGFIATATGGYSVAIDGTPYADYASNAQFSMTDWTDYTDTPGYDITEPTGATKAHIIDIYPQTESENIAEFKCSRVDMSGNEEQGILWAHFNLTNSINISSAFGDINVYYQPLMLAITSRNNTIKTNSMQSAFAMSRALEYIPILNGQNNNISIRRLCYQNYKLKDITFTNINFTNMQHSFYQCHSLADVKGTFNSSGTEYFTGAFFQCEELKTAIPLKLDFSNAIDMNEFIVNTENMHNFILDLSTATKLKRLYCSGSITKFIAGLKKIRISNEAPFDNATPPQINVSYTGLDKSALVQLFNDLPIVSAGQIISIVGATGASDLTADDEAIATAKGWTITR